MTVIGYEFLTKSQRFKLTGNKVHLLKCWFRRLREKRGRRVTTQELRSLFGTLVWCRAALPLSGRFIRGGFGLTALKKWEIYQPRWLTFDLDSIEDLLVYDEGTAMAIPEPAPPPLSRQNNISWTDASREPGPKGFREQRVSAPEHEFYGIANLSRSTWTTSRSTCWKV